MGPSRIEGRLPDIEAAVGITSRYFARRGIVGARLQDLRQQLWEIALSMAEEGFHRYDPDKGVSFVAYLYVSLRRQGANYLTHGTCPVSVPRGKLKDGTAREIEHFSMDATPIDPTWCPSPDVALERAEASSRRRRARVKLRRVIVEEAGEEAARVLFERFGFSSRPTHLMSEIAGRLRMATEDAKRLSSVGRGALGASPKFYRAAGEYLEALGDERQADAHRRSGWTG